MKIEAVLFDIDGTVYSNNIMHLYSIPLFCKYSHFLMHFSKARKYLHYHVAEIDASGLNFAQFQAKYMAELTQNRFSPQECQASLNVFRTEWEQIFSKIKPYQHFKATVIAFKEAGFKVGLFSDFPLSDKMARLGLDGLWDVAVSAEDCGALKPDPRGFLVAAELCGVSPDKVLFVGNSYAYDVLGAKAAGMHTAHLRYGGPVKNSEADITFYDYRVLKNQVLTWTPLN
jgi:putative hydrolase of the HAD superfamily